MSEEPVNIFWTGGFDSTFRVLQLLIVEKRKVQPFFIVRAQKSVGQEINAMIDIRRQLFNKFPSVRNLLLPTQYIDIRQISEYIEISDAYEIIKRECKIAQQFEFLAFFCKAYDIHTIELSIEEDGNKKNRVFNFLSGNVAKNSEGLLKLVEEKCSSLFEKSVFELFRYYSFPIIHTSRAEMIKIARLYNYYDLLVITWSCASPFRGKPCGFCNPCLHTIETRRPNRIPVLRKIASKLHLPLRQVYRKYMQSKKNKHEEKYS